jgi:hypothetical protein
MDLEGKIKLIRKLRKTNKLKSALKKTSEELNLYRRQNGN